MICDCTACTARTQVDFLRQHKSEKVIVYFLTCRCALKGSLGGAVRREMGGSQAWGQLGVRLEVRQA